MLSFEYIASIMPSILNGAIETLKIFFLTLLFSLPIGLFVSFGSMSKIFPIRLISQAYVFVLRGTPLLLQLFFIYYALPRFTPITLDRFPAAIVTFSLNYSAYFSEIFRAGITSIEKGQYEAGHSLGFSKAQTMSLIIIPQTIGRIIPPISNEIITLVKDTALVYAIALPELLKSAKDAANRDVNPTAFFVAGCVYLAMTFLLTALSKYLEKHFSKHVQEVRL